MHLLRPSESFLLPGASHSGSDVATSSPYHHWLSQTLQECGPHFSMAPITPTAAAGRGALALRFSPKRSKETQAAIDSVPTPWITGCSKAQWFYTASRERFCMTKQPSWMLWTGGQLSASYSAFPFTSFSHFPFSLNSAALGLHTPMKCSTKALIQTHFLKWYFSNINVHTNHWGPG